ncbi:MAG: multifunctional CCA tRNA nucleotidyl transferase/2'3'-cyclic phosphodiesterase/2'nucleotidase/phosphatase [Gammaproteobacteria bacterium]|nr:MAG: multifunctional CCA tRNA nucleotidyl transferase/2'3'-cyclic phosphodiesterase/2'nucleotidase/phosphatase [Gammaproteobacteria bacterium]
MQTWLVGGAVRDKLLGIPAKDRDWVVVGATPEEMLAAGFTRADADFPVFIHPQTGEEYALARVEYKTGCGYKGFEIHAGPDVTLEQDLKRRDFTINAMAMNEDGEVVDPFHGRDDLQNGRIRHVSDAFSEDPLRLLRAARFAARFRRHGFHIAHETQRLMQEMAQSGELRSLTPARIWSEMSRALSEPNPEVFFRVLHSSGALKDVFPELANCLGADARSHQALPELLETLALVAKQTSDPVKRWAALLFLLHQCDTSVDVLEISKRYNAPASYRNLPLALVELSKQLQAPADLDAVSVYRLLESHGALRNPSAFMELLAFSKSLPGANGNAMATLEKALHAVLQVQPEAYIQSGLQAKELGDALKQAKIAAIAQATGETP